LEHFLSWFLSSEEFWSALIGAVIGGALTGWFTLRAQKQAPADQRQREEAERRAVGGVLRRSRRSCEPCKRTASIHWRRSLKSAMKRIRS